MCTGNLGPCYGTADDGDDSHISSGDGTDVNWQPDADVAAKEKLYSGWRRCVLDGLCRTDDGLAKEPGSDRKKGEEMHIAEQNRVKEI